MGLLRNRIRRGSIDIKYPEEITWKDKVFVFCYDYIYDPIERMWRYSTPYNVYHWIRCWWRGYHIVPTYPKLKAGYWYDCDTMLEHALTGIMHRYLSPEGEDAFTVVSWEGKEEEKKMLLDAYHWMTIVRPSLEVKCDDLLKEMYEDLDRNKPWTEPVEDGRNMLRLIPLSERLNEEQYAKYEKLRIERDGLEKRIYDETTEHLCNVIKIRNYLWT